MTARRVLSPAALALLLCLAAPSCRSRRVVHTEAAEQTAVHIVRSIESDSLRLVAVVSVEKPRLTLRPDSGLAVEGDRAVARVIARSGRTHTMESSDSSAARIARKSVGADTLIERPRLWPLVLGLVLIALSFIALSWIGIRARR